MNKKKVSENKTIAKNTLLLYFRMFLVMGVTLYTSRIVLDQLGVSDYGLYSLVGGVVSMFAFFNSAMSSATQRYLAFDLGQEDEIKLQKTFGATLTIHIGIAILILILAETIGLWYVNNKIVLPPDRLFAANVVYQFSIAAALVGVIQIPYDAMIIAHERMNIYAYVSILEVSLKLGAVFLLVFLDGDKLILYAIFIFIVSVVIRIIYQVYCRRNFKASKYIFNYDKKYYRELISYSGWNLFGNVASVARGQGLNVVLNLFYGTVVNAAYGLTLQVQGAVNLFVTNFTKAVNPQIIKSYSRGDLARSHLLITKSSKFSFLLMLLIVTPILFNTDYILILWLKEVPEYTKSFVQLSLIAILIDSLSGVLMTGAQATGRIKRYQAVVGTLIFLNLPISFILLKMNFEPNIVFFVVIIISLVSFNFRLYFLKEVMNFPIVEYHKQVTLRITLIVLCFGGIYLFRQKHLINNFYEFLYQSICLMVMGTLFIYVLGIDRKERKLMTSYIKNKFAG